MNTVERLVLLAISPACYISAFCLWVGGTYLASKMAHNKLHQNYVYSLLLGASVVGCIYMLLFTLFAPTVLHAGMLVACAVLGLASSLRISSIKSSVAILLLGIVVFVLIACGRYLTLGWS
jgi:hypothetical protein